MRARVASTPGSFHRLPLRIGAFWKRVSSAEIQPGVRRTSTAKTTSTIATGTAITAATSAMRSRLVIG
jgi:hypothetical protein